MKIRPHVTCQITRGVAPAFCIADAVVNGSRYGNYHLVSGLAAAEAKQHAVSIAMEAGEDLILCEDDFQAPPEIWAGMAEVNGVGMAPAMMRGGVNNTKYRADGSVLYSGTVFLKISLWVLEAIHQPCFEPWCYSRKGEEMHDDGPNTENGRGSDVRFWKLLREIDPEPPVTEFPMIKHFFHDASSYNTGYQSPSRIEHFK